MTAAIPFDDLSTSPRSAMVLNRSSVRWYATCVVVVGLLGAAAGYAAHPLVPVSYSASSQMVFGAPATTDALGTGAGSVTASTLSQSAAEILGSQEVAADASKLLHGRLSTRQVTDQTSITPTANSPVVVIAAQAANPALAQQLANAIPQAYADVERRSYAQHAQQTAQLLQQVLADQEKRLAAVQAQMTAKVQSVGALAVSILPVPTDQATYVQAWLATDATYQQWVTQANDLTTKIDQTQDAIQQTTVDTSAQRSGVDQVIPAPLPEASALPAVERDMAVGLGVGVLLGALLAWRLTERRGTVDPAVAAATLGAPLLGSVRRDRRLRRPPGFVDLGSDDALSNELKVLAAALLLSAGRRGLGAVVVTSAHRREGTSVLTRNLAMAAEYTGQPVVLVDAGFGRPTTTELLDLEESPGLAQVVEGEPPSRHIQQLGYEDGRRVPVLPIGLDGFATEPGRKLNEARRANWARALPDMRPMIPLVDAPAISDHPLALQLASGGGLVVIASPKTTLSDLEMIRNRAEVADVPVLGFVLNSARSRSAGRKGRRRRRSAAPRTVNVVADPAVNVLADAAEDEQTTAG